MEDSPSDSLTFKAGWNCAVEHVPLCQDGTADSVLHPASIQSTISSPFQQESCNLLEMKIVMTLVSAVLFTYIYAHPNYNI